MNPFIFVFLLILVLTGNILFFWLEKDLKTKGFQFSKINSFFSVFNNSISLIKNTKDTKTKRNYIWKISILGIIFMALPIIFFSSTESVEDWQNRRQNDYLIYEVNGTIASKYIDKPNHATKTLILKDGREETEVNRFVLGLYEYLEPNDSISKISGSTAIKVYRNGELKMFNTN